MGCGGLNFVRSIIWPWAHCSAGSEGGGWESRDKAKLSDWLRLSPLGSATAAELKLIRRPEIKFVDTRRAMLSLEDAFESPVLHQTPAVRSSMIEMERFI